MTEEMDKCRFSSSSYQFEEIIKAMIEHTDELMTKVLAKTKKIESTKGQQLFCNDALESVVEEEDYDKENNSHFEVIANMNRQKLTFGLYYGSVIGRCKS